MIGEKYINQKKYFYREYLLSSTSIKNFLEYMNIQIYLKKKKKLN